MPRKGFLPPMTVRVDMMMDFVPPYSVTGKSVYNYEYIMVKETGPKEN